MKKILFILFCLMSVSVNAKLSPTDYCNKSLAVQLKNNQDMRDSLNITGFCDCFGFNFRKEVSEAKFDTVEQWDNYLKKLNGNPFKIAAYKNVMTYCIIENLYNIY